MAFRRHAGRLGAKAVQRSLGRLADGVLVLGTKLLAITGLKPRIHWPEQDEGVTAS